MNINNTFSCLNFYVATFVTEMVLFLLKIKLQYFYCTIRSSFKRYFRLFKRIVSNILINYHLVKNNLKVIARK